MIETTEKAILAGDCFWGMQDLLRKRPGVISTRVGYTGGQLRALGERRRGLALGAWALRRGWMSTEQIGRQTVGFFVLTSMVNVGGVIVFAALYATASSARTAIRRSPTGLEPGP
jgi:hypothetical protein